MRGRNQTTVTPAARAAFDALMDGGKLDGEDPAAWGAFAGGLQEINALPETDRRLYFLKLCDGPQGERWRALGAAEAVAPTFQVWTADRLLTEAFPEPVWAIPEVLPVGLTILAGKPKVGKSWLALQIAQAVAAGGRALGYAVQRGPVLYLALEDPPRRLQTRMLAQHWPVGTEADFLTLGDYAAQVGDLSGEGAERLAQQVQQEAYRLVVIDTLSRAIFGDQNDVAVMTAALTPIQETAHELDIAVLLIDHHRKSFGTDADAVGDILGSTAKGAMCDTAWGLYRERGKGGAKLQVIGRDVIEHTIALHFDGLTSCWQSDGDAEQLEMTERREEIIEALRDLGPMGASELARVIDQDRGNTYKRLQDLVGAGQVVRQEKRYAIP